MGASVEFLFLVDLISFVFFGSSGKDVEDLFERSLRGRVLLNVELLFDVFHHAEDEANRLRVTTDFESVRVAIVFQELELLKFAFKVLDQELSMLFDVSPPQNLVDVQFTTLLQYAI